MNHPSSPVKLLDASDLSGLVRLVLWRTFLILVLLGISVSALYVVRDGFVDTLDGEVSVMDIIYFMSTSLITLSYGDIIPASQMVRIIDTVLLTVVRVFIWLILFGTAYEVLFIRSMEVLRMRSLKTKLKNHYIICGLGELGHSTIDALLESGVRKREIVGIDKNAEQAQEIADLDIPVLHADASKELTLNKADIKDAKALIVCSGRDDTNILISLTAKHLNPNVRVVARASERENITLLRKSGADDVITPAIMAAKLVAESAIKDK